jgi:ATP-dependent DNA ligase
MTPIIPVIRREPFDDPAWLFEFKLDGFRGLADTVNVSGADFELLHRIAMRATNPY